MDDPVIDPETGQPTNTLTVTSEPQTVQVLAGYGYDGQVHVTTAYDAGDPLEVSTVRQIGDATVDISLAGSTRFDVLPLEPAAELGTLTDAQIDVTGSGSSGGYTCTGRADMCQLQMTRVSSGEPGKVVDPSGVRTTKMDATHYRATEIFPLENVPVRAAANSQEVDRATTRTVKQDRDYEKRGNDWVLTRVRHESVAAQAGGSTRHVQSILLTNVRFHRNAELDARRKERREKIASRGSGGPQLSPVGLRPVVACDAECGGDPGSSGSGGGSGGGSSSGSYPYEPPVNEDAQIQSDLITSPGSGEIGLVLQHGFATGSDTWRQMHTWLGTDMNVNRITRHSLPWRETYESQADSLQRALAADNASGPIVLIGHSNGGMLSRYLGRHQSGAYAVQNIRGVITVGTPHKGAPLANLAPSLQKLNGWGGWSARIVCPIFGMAGCSRFGQLADAPVAHYITHLAQYVPVLDEMRPRDGYHDSFNAESESFQKYGVESYVWNHWLEWGLNGDMVCYTWDTLCGGHAEVKTTDRVYHHDISCSIVGLFTARWSKAIKCALDGGFLKGVDLLMIKYTASDNFASDGVVPKWSQLYPNIPQQDQYEIIDGPYHTGETKSPDVRVQLERALVDHFGVSRK